ncbi:hypothetical protein [Tateyamaria omphalii]|uniref:Uncharacterized protein n=1 Tax=Tateyamaria omphalii TaxID=299262 RepID=A0A1P8MUC7_9RHOB|nr:hypothetical protein [Tateyamaria omphalii]APX11602.1 hypothetical protein BWR18_07835 [Tateyamaria omphalii]
MTDPAKNITVLELLISELDPRRHEVAIAHLQDAIEALDAASRGDQTRYAKSGKIVNGTVTTTGKIRLFR